MKLQGRVALIVGGGVGAGREIAFTFAREGASIALAGRRKDKLDEVVQEIEQNGGQALGVVADATDEAQVIDMVRQTIERHGKVDILVNTAGFRGPTVALHELKEQDWDAVLQVNLKAPFLCSKAVLKPMIEQRHGNILFMSGTAGREGFPNRAALCAAKWALEGLARTIAMEAGPFGVRANVMCPGGVMDEAFWGTMEKIGRASGKTAEEVEQGFLERTPLRKWASLEDIARVALFLASDDSSHITGESVNVSGGYLMG